MLETASNTTSTCTYSYMSHGHRTHRISLYFHTIAATAFYFQSCGILPCSSTTHPHTHTRERVGHIWTEDLFTVALGLREDSEQGHRVCLSASLTDVTD